jgi:hypothetical protein
MAHVNKKAEKEGGGSPQEKQKNDARLAPSCVEYQRMSIAQERHCGFRVGVSSSRTKGSAGRTRGGNGG